MSRYPFFQVDAFSDRPLEGNPCAVLLDTEDLDAGTMQAIAVEMNLSETAFVTRSSSADFGARYFTPAEEIPLAGHPTLAVARALLDSGRLELSGRGGTFTLELKAGTVEVEVDRSGEGETIFMTQLPPRFLATYEPATVLGAFALDPDDLLPGAPIQTVSTGTPQLMVPLASPQALRRARLERTPYDRMREHGDFFSPHLFCLYGFTAAGRTSARHFGVPPDTVEDPFTGSATGGMAAYLWRYNLLDTPRFFAEQGHGMNRPGTATVEISGAPGAPESIRVGGAAVTLLRGELGL